MSVVHVSERHFREKGVVARLTQNTGWGLFADRDFEPGAHILRLSLDDTLTSNIIDWRDSFGKWYDRSFTIVPDYAYVCTPDYPFWYLNHSCQPNSGFVNWGRLEDHYLPVVAYRHIAIGEEIVADYSLFTTRYDGDIEGNPWTMEPCLCHQHNCRHKITGFDAMPLPLQLEAIRPVSPAKGKVLAHILQQNSELVDRLRRTSPSSYAQYLEAFQQQMTLSAEISRRRHGPNGHDRSHT